MRKAIGILSLFCGAAFTGLAAERPSAAVPLWADGAPGALGKDDKDIPSLTPYWAENPNGASVVVFPGGGYNSLAPHEAEPFARWLNSLGVTAFVLKYRLYSGGYTLPVIFKDAQRAVRQVHSHAKEWNLDPARVGVIGSSAGGHLISVLSTQFDSGLPDSADPVERASCRPDFTIVCYGFILFDQKTMPDPKKREKALGPNATDEQALFFAPARNVKADSPPIFIWQTVEDPTVTLDNALTLADALRKEKVPFDLHLYEKGKHGIGLGTKTFDPEKLHPWTRACADWMRQRGLLAGEKK